MAAEQTAIGGASGPRASKGGTRLGHSRQDLPGDTPSMPELLCHGHTRVFLKIDGAE